MRVNTSAMGVRKRSCAWVSVIVIVAMMMMIRMRMVMSHMIMVLMRRMFVRSVAVMIVRLMRVMMIMVFMSVRRVVLKYTIVARAQLRRTPTLRQQKDPHPQDEEPGNQTEHGKQSFRDDEARCNQGCKAQREYAQRVGHRYRKTKEYGVPGRAAGADQIRTDNGLAVTR